LEAVEFLGDLTDGALEIPGDTMGPTWPRTSTLRSLGTLSFWPT
jgi:hypothetical protein